MDTVQIYKARDEMQRSITESVKKFETETGMIFDGLNIERINTRAGEMIVNITCDVKLPRIGR